MSDLSFFREIQPADEAAGLVMATKTSDSLAASIRRLLTIPPQTRNAAARHEADKYPWDKVVLPVVDVFRQWGGN